MTNIKYYAIIYFDLSKYTNNIEAIFSNEESAIAYIDIQDKLNMLYYIIQISEKDYTNF